MGHFEAERQQAFLRTLGLLDPVPIELVEAGSARPQFAERWSEIHTFTISYGHGISSSPLHLAAAYAPLVNGGHKVTPTLLRQPKGQLGAEVMSEQTAAKSMAMLRKVLIGRLPPSRWNTNSSSGSRLVELAWLSRLGLEAWAKWGTDVQCNDI